MQRTNPTSRPGLGALAIVVTSIVMIQGCSDGGSTEQTIPTVPANGDTTNPGEFNGGLTGRLVFHHDDTGASQLDLSTGVVSTIPFADTPQEFLERNNLEQADDDFVFISTNNNSSTGYTYTLPECLDSFPDTQFPGVFVDSCVFIYNQDLSVRRQFRTREIELSAPPLISPSGKYLIMTDLTGLAGSGTSILYIADIDIEIGDFYKETQVLDEVPDPDSLSGTAAARPPALAWTPNDEVIYSVNGPSVVIKITEPASLTVANTITLPATYGGLIHSLDVSPDGSKLLIDYSPDIAGANESGVLLLDLTTLDISVPAIVPDEIGIVPLGDNIVGNIREPRWSPDGQWIIVTEGFSSVFGVGSGLGTDRELYAIPADKQRTVLTTEQPTDAILIRSENSSNRGNLVDHWSWSGNYYWTN